MTPLFSCSPRGGIAICLLAVLALAIAASGCTQPASQQPAAPAPVTVTQTDNSRILLTYPGSTATNDLLELEITVTDSAGKSQTKSLGDRHSTMPLRFGATETFSGTFTGNDRVIVTGYFMDSSHRQLLETTV